MGAPKAGGKELHDIPVCIPRHCPRCYPLLQGPALPPLWLPFPLRAPPPPPAGKELLYELNNHRPSASRSPHALTTCVVTMLCLDAKCFRYIRGYAWHSHTDAGCSTSKHLWGVLNRLPHQQLRGCRVQLWKQASLKASHQEHHPFGMLRLFTCAARAWCVRHTDCALPVSHSTPGEACRT